jgi:hypothetical protein
MEQQLTVSVEVQIVKITKSTRKIIGGEHGSGLPTYFRRQTDTGLPRDRSDFCRSPGLPLPSSSSIGTHR